MTELLSGAQIEALHKITHREHRTSDAPTFRVGSLTKRFGDGEPEYVLWLLADGSIGPRYFIRRSGEIWTANDLWHPVRAVTAIDAGRNGPMVVPTPVKTQKEG